MRILPPNDIRRGKISMDGPQSLGYDLLGVGGTFAAAAWPAVNRALYIPFYLDQLTIFDRIVVFSSAAAGNVDVGLFNGLSFAKLVSSGSTAVVAGYQPIAVTATTLPPGFYLWGMSSDTAGATQTWFRWAPADLARVLITGVKQEAAAFPLPATATPASPASTYVPFIEALQVEFLY
jgi:hypothetical protein